MRIRIIYILRWRNSYPTTKNIIFKEGNKIEGPHESERITMNNNIDSTQNIINVFQYILNKSDSN